MKSISAALLLLAATAQAQPTVGPEVVWRRTAPAATYQPPPQAARLSADGSGYLVTWSEVEDGVSRAYLGSLDARGRLTSVGVRTVGAADAASAAPFGDRLIAAWLEPESDGRPLAVVGVLDRAFHLLASAPVALVVAQPVVVRATQSRAFVGVGAAVYEVNRDGGVLTAATVPVPVDDLTTAGGDVAWVFHTHAHHDSSCHPMTLCVDPTGDLYSVTFTKLNRSTATISTPVPGDARPAIAGGDSFLVVWFEPGLVKGALLGLQFAPFTISSRAPETLDARAQPQVAWDGRRWLVVWSSHGAILGAAIDADRNVTALNVSPSGGRPTVATATTGHFLVTYEVLEGDERRLASRVIDFEPPPPGRVRAIR